MAKEVKDTQEVDVPEVQKTEQQEAVEKNFEQVTINTPEQVAKNVKDANLDYLDINNPDHGNKKYDELKK